MLFLTLISPAFHITLPSASFSVICCQYFNRNLSWSPLCFSSYSHSSLSLVQTLISETYTFLVMTFIVGFCIFLPLSCCTVHFLDSSLPIVVITNILSNVFMYRLRLSPFGDIDIHQKNFASSELGKLKSRYMAVGHAPDTGQILLPSFSCGTVVERVP